MKKANLTLVTPVKRTTIEKPLSPYTPTSNIPATSPVAPNAPKRVKTQKRDDLTDTAKHLLFDK
jgi:hypothetical protein